MEKENFKNEFKNNVLGLQIEEELAEQSRQEKLHKKYKIEDENIKVVEKPSLTKFLLKTVMNIIRWLLNFVVIILTAIGIIALCYEQIRMPLFQILKEAISSII